MQLQHASKEAEVAPGRMDISNKLQPHRWSFVTGKLQPKGQQDKINAAGVLLFKNMFELSPRLKLLFPFKDAAGEALDSELAKHGTRVLTTLGSVVQRLTDLDSLMPDLRTLCARHIKYGVEMEHYDILASACLSTMETALGETWSQDYKNGWFSVFGIIGAAAQQVNTPSSSRSA